MYLVKFILYGSILSLVLGEFGRFPFGISGAISLTDGLIILMILFFFIWQVVNKNKIYISKVFLLTLAFLMIGVVSLLWSLSRFSLPDVVKGGGYLVRFSAYTLVFTVVYNLKKYKILDFEQLSNFYIVSGLILAIFGFIQLVIFPNFDTLTQFGYDPHLSRLSSTFLDPNFIGCYLVMAFGLLTVRVKGKEKSVFDRIYFFVILLAVILTFSRSAYLMLLVFSILFGLIAWRKLLIFMLVFSLLSALIFPRSYQRITSALTLDITSQERIQSWENGLKVFQLNPLIGIGFNNIRAASEQLNLFKTYSFDGGHSGGGFDSSFITVMVMTGIIGISIYLIIWADILKNLLKKKTFEQLAVFSVLVSLLINGQFINSLLFPPIMLFYYGLLGITYE